MTLKTVLNALFRINSEIRIDAVNKTGYYLVWGLVPYGDDCAIGYKKVSWYEVMNAKVIKLEPINGNWVKLVIDL